MEDLRRRSTIRSTAPNMEDRQASTLDDQKHGAEDGDQQALSLDDQKSAAEDGGTAGTDARRSDARERI